MKGLLARHGKEVAANGYPVIPIKLGGKAPRFSGWEHTPNATPEMIDAWLSDRQHDGAGVGILTKFTPAVDIDVLDADLVRELVSWISDNIAPAPQRIGRAPKTLLLFQCDKPFRKVLSAKFRSPDDAADSQGHRVEILGEGQQFVAFHVHPETLKPYTWTTEATPLNTPALDLPILTHEGAIAICREFERIAEARGWVRLSDSKEVAQVVDRSPEAALLDEDPPEPTAVEVARVKSALEAITLPRDYFRWRDVLFALKWTRWKCAEDLARAWSEKHEEHDPKQFRIVWRGAEKRDSGSKITLASLYAEAKAFGWNAKRSTTSAPRAMEDGEVSVRTASDIEPRVIAWLWDGWIAQGKLVIVAGAPGTGKTTIAITCAAIVSRGAAWPDGTRCPVGDVLIWSGEDDPQDTLVPRLIAAGADLARVHFVGDTSDGLDRRPFDPATDMPALQARAAALGTIRLLIVDPIVSAVAGDSHKNAEVRRALAPLVTFAEACGAALMGISHFTKGTAGREPLERVTGSVAFGAVARIVWVTAKKQNEDGTSVRILARAKSNVGPDDGGFSYGFELVSLADYPDITASRISWGEALSGHARDLIAEPERPEGTKSDDAGAWLHAQLLDGAVQVKVLQEAATAAGHSWRTVQRAKGWAGVRSRRSGTSNKAPHEWYLPEGDDSADTL